MGLGWVQRHRPGTLMIRELQSFLDRLTGKTPVRPQGTVILVDGSGIAWTATDRERWKARVRAMSPEEFNRHAAEIPDPDLDKGA